MADVPRYAGTFEAAQAERLLWRGAFGGSKERARKLAQKGLKDAVRSLTRPEKKSLKGPAPTDEGHGIKPYDQYGHDVLWVLDRLVRTQAPALERMALIWHDWFATADVGAKLAIDQWKLFRKHAMGNFRDLVRGVTEDPAMLIWLSGIYNHKDYPNENYGRELMELFTLGAAIDGYPYTEDDVREQARALTGFAAGYRDDVGYVNFRFEKSRHDNGQKTIFGQTGNWDWKDSCRLCLEHDAHAPFFVSRMWEHFVPEPADSGTQAALEELYRDSGYEIRPVVEAILMHPRLYEGPAIVKPPLVALAGMMRLRKRYIDINDWYWVSDLAGQRPFRPPNVSGWDEERWLDTSTFRGRWYAASYLVRPDEIAHDANYDESETATEAVDKALRFFGDPTLTDATREELIAFGESVENYITAGWQNRQARILRQNAMRMLIATSPDLQAS